MKPLYKTVLALIATAASAATVSAAVTATGDVALRDVLGGFDFVPSRAQLDDQLDQPAASLRAIASGVAEHDDPGLRIRAYRALRLYPTPEVERALIEAVQARGRTDAFGVEVLYLRAAVESLAVVAGPRGVEPLRPLLDHPSRDIRASAARALAICGTPAALPALRSRLTSESEAQVRLALSEAIRALTDA